MKSSGMTGSTSQTITSQYAPDWITFIADGLPQLVWQPLDPLMRSLLYVPDKYAAVVYKLHT
jgi:hypothetical protein